MSQRNGDRARFHKDRKRKLHHRQRIKTLVGKLGKETDDRSAAAPPPTARPPR